VLGLSIEKLAVLMLLGVILVGPDRLPGLVREAAQLLRKLRHLADDATRDLREEMGPEFADLRPQDLHPRALLQKHIIDPVFADEPVPVEKPTRSTTYTTDSDIT
jgi:sec-independent protein translocase protein TatB